MTMGRPKIPIDYKLVQELASIFCTQPEIASVLKVSLSTLEHDEDAKAAYHLGLNTARESLRRAQWSAAQKGNTGMLVWLGKQYLDQKEKNEFSGPGGQPLFPGCSLIDGKSDADIVSDLKSLAKRRETR